MNRPANWRLDSNGQIMNPHFTIPKSNSHIGPPRSISPRLRASILESCRYAGKVASRHGRNFERHSELAKKRERNITELRWRDVVLGKQLGSGTFSIVHEAALSGKYQKSPRYQEFSKVEREGDISKANARFTCLNSQVGGDQDEEAKPQFALKHLDPERMKGNFSDCAIDLVMEAKLLSCLSHENIVKLYAVTAGSVSKVFTTKKGYFLLLERLTGTLEERLGTWSLGSPETVPSVRDRLRCIALGIISGCKYLHNNNIILRDLKPSNVGFGNDDKVKIFDFGLAREIVDGGKRLTGYTGSARYMAPEVALGDDYGLSADCYSFGILLWEVLTLTKAFRGMSKEEHLELVVCSRVRPKLGAVVGDVPARIKKLIQAAWHSRAEKRPTFERMEAVLRQEVFPVSSDPKQKVARARRETWTNQRASVEFENGTELYPALSDQKMARAGLRVRRSTWIDQQTSTGWKSENALFPISSDQTITRVGPPRARRSTWTGPRASVGWGNENETKLIR